MKFPIEVDSIEDKFARELAKDMTYDGIDGMFAMPLAIHLMYLVFQYQDNLQAGIERIKQDRKKSDEWWVKYHPRTKRAKEAKMRLKENKENL